MKKVIIAIILSWVASRGIGQEFEVSSFRLLQNDITAWVDPVRDLNHEACALIKVVGSHDFVFSTPLGVVRRRNEVGEIWLYVPNGTMKLTIKHPRWGVMRDYLFPDRLESRLTYELVITPPPPKIDGEAYPRVRALFTGLQQQPLEVELSPLNTGKYKHGCPEYTMLFTTGWNERRAAFGVMAIRMKRHGVYMHGQCDFRFLSADGDCNRDGMMLPGDETPYYTGSVDESRYAVLAGGVHRVVHLCYIYEGIGYGKRQVLWETLEGKQLRNREYSYKGLAGEVGLLFKLSRAAIMAGVMTIRGEYWEPIVGIGINF